MKKILFPFCAVCIVLIGFFVIGEICFRLVKKPINPLIQVTQKSRDYLFPPNTNHESQSSKEGEYHYWAHYNKFGYRGKDFAVPKPKGVIRIFAVGDSFTYGVGAEDNQTIPYVLQEELKKINPGVEVINAGIGHSSPIMHYINLKRIHLKYEPDFVVLFFDLTDLRDDWDFERHAVRDQEGEIVDYDLSLINGKRDWWIYAAQKSAFCEWIHRKIIRSFSKIQQMGFKNYFKALKEGKRAKAVIATSNGNLSDDVLMEHDGVVMMRGREKQDIIERQWPRTAKYLLKIKALLEEKQIPFLLIMYPHGIYVGANQWTEGRKTWGLEPGKLYTDRYSFDLVENFAKENQIPFYNTLDDFLNAPLKDYFFNWDGHMTPAGYEVVGKSVAKSKVFLRILEKVAQQKTYSR